MPKKATQKQQKTTVKKPRAKKELSPEELEERKEKRRAQLAQARAIKAQKKLQAQQAQLPVAEQSPPQGGLVEKEEIEQPLSVVDKPVVVRRRGPPTQFCPN
tara:strand:- start:319 stop:624 length:306 start_codon:yes stop_codon:yes gene_type:complete